MTQSAPAIANPFPGLRPFRENEEHLFFGREGQVDAMIDKLAVHRFLAVLGTSGSGKSSLVNCGLRPALHRGLMAHSGTSWRIAQFRPGRDPIGALADSLSVPGLLFPPAPPDRLPVRQIVEDTLRMSKRGLVETVRQARLPEKVNVLVIADQFEELFRYRRTGVNLSQAAEEATAFVNLLLEGAAQHELRIYIVLTMRSDFLGDCAQFAGLAEAINGGQYLVPRLTREERRAAIAGPVAVGGGLISPVLLSRLINDVGDNPDQLSILQHALNRTWSYWMHEGNCQGPLTLEHYQAIGTMTGALDKHAEKSFGELDRERQAAICEKIFEALTDMGTDARGIRRPTQFRNLCAIAAAEPAEVEAVMNVFRKPSRSFLMPPVGEPLRPETVVDVSHESLMRLWKRLDLWAREEADSAQLYRRLADTARRHAREEAALWTDPELQFALDWRKRTHPTTAWADLYGGDFDLAMSFLDASEAARARRIAEEREDQERELEQARCLADARAKSARLLRFGIAAAVLVAIFGFALFVWANKERNRALKAQKAAETATAGAQAATDAAKRATDAAVAAAVQLSVKHGETVKLAQAAELARQEAKANLEKALTLRATSYINQLAMFETPPSPTDSSSLWELFDASSDLMPYVLTHLFTSENAMRKAPTRSYALRRSIIGFNGRRDIMVRDALNRHCTPAGMRNLYVTAMCIGLGRGFYPVDTAFVVRVEDAIQGNWEDWDRQNIRAIPELNQTFRDSVASNFLNLIHGLGSAGAASVSQHWFKDLTERKPWREHILAAWNRAVENMNPADADHVAQRLIASPQGAEVLGEHNPSMNGLAVLANATSPEGSAKVWEVLLSDPTRCLDRVWLTRLSLAAPKLDARGAAVVQRKLVTALPENLEARDQTLWLSLVKMVAEQTSRADAIAIAQEILARPSVSSGPPDLLFATLQAVTSQASTSNLNALVRTARDERAVLLQLKERLAKAPAPSSQPAAVADKLEVLISDERLDERSQLRLKNILSVIRANPRDIKALNDLSEALLNSARPSGGQTAPPEIAEIQGVLRLQVETLLESAPKRFPSEARASLNRDLQTPVAPKPPELAESDRATPAVRLPLQTVPFNTNDKIAKEIDRRLAALVSMRIQKETDFTKKTALLTIDKEAKGRLTEALRQKFSSNDELKPRLDEYQQIGKEQEAGEKVFALLASTPASIHNPGEALMTIASYMRQESRGLLETRAFAAFLDVLTALPSNASQRRAAMDELLKINDSDRSMALCYRLDPEGPNSAAAYRLLEAWGTDVDRTIVEKILQWPDCPPNAVFPVVRKLADIKGVGRKELGDRNGLVVMEQFAAWAKSHGYSFLKSPK
jgi:hypothetical protein